MAANSNTFDKLNDENYSAWAKYMKAHLVKKDLWDIVSGDTPRPVGGAHHRTITAWQKKHDIAAAEILLHVSPKYITHCNESDVVGTWIKLKLLFRTEGCSSIAALRRQFNSMRYDGGMPMRDWVTKVEDLVRQLEDIGSPMIPIDIINTLIRDLPESYAPFIVLAYSWLDDPIFTINHEVIQEIIKRLLNEEARQSEATRIDGMPSALLVRDHRKPGSCHNCGEIGHLKTDCELSPKEVRMRREHKLRPRKDQGQAKLVVDSDDESNTHTVL